MSKLRKALERAREDRGSFGEVAVWEGKKELSSGAVDLPGRGARREVNPVYRQTRVVAVDPSTLKKNKVFALSPQNGIADQIKILRTQVIKTLKEVGGNTLLVTSANEGEGKTLTAVNLAVSMSQELDKTVLLVDADLKTPSIHKYFQIPETLGLSDHLTRDMEIPELLINPGIQKLTVLPAGRPLYDSSEHLGAPRMEGLVREMKGRYPERIIIFDSSSLLTSADPLVFSRFVDGVLLVAEAEKTSRNDFKRAVELLKGSTILGTVFNKVRG